jgi:hypothetical protein
METANFDDVATLKTPIDTHSLDSTGIGRHGRRTCRLLIFCSARAWCAVAIMADTVPFLRGS